MDKISAEVNKSSSEADKILPEVYQKSSEVNKMLLQVDEKSPESIEKLSLSDIYFKIVKKKLLQIKNCPK